MTREAAEINTEINTDSFTGNWAWLFPASYLIHVAEEYWGGFPVWIERFWGVESSPGNFLSWNGGAWVMMAVGVALVLKKRSYRWLLVGFGAVVLINGAAHALSSLWTSSYSPGLISGLLLFVPLGLFTLRRARRSRMNSRTFRAGIILGVLMHAVVVLLAFGYARLV
jgi:hypothetical protein